MWRVPMRHGFVTEYRGTINAMIKLDGMGTFAILRVTDVRCFHVDHPDKGRNLPPPADMQAECVSKLVPA